MFKYLFFLFILIAKCGFSEPQCYFIPPSNWKIADPKSLSKRTIIGFIDKKQSGLSPSINLTFEKIQIPLKEYLEIVRKNCKAKKQNWQSLGTIETVSGKAALASIEVNTKFGMTRLLQAILAQENTVFILTTGCLKKDFSQYIKTFKDTISSMTIADNLLSAIKDENKKIALRNAWQKKINNLDSEEFDRLVLRDCAFLGPCWQMLMLRQGVSYE